MVPKSTFWYPSMTLCLYIYLFYLILESFPPPLGGPGGGRLEWEDQLLGATAAWNAVEQLVVAMAVGEW